jgi:hypothetical protein
MIKGGAIRSDLLLNKNQSLINPFFQASLDDALNKRKVVEFNSHPKAGATYFDNSRVLKELQEKLFFGFNLRDNSLFRAMFLG